MSERYIDAMSDENTRLYAENQDLKEKLRMVQASADDVWFWQHEGNEPESLTCPVVMSAATFRKYELARDLLRTLEKTLIGFGNMESK